MPNVACSLTGGCIEPECSSARGCCRENLWVALHLRCDMCRACCATLVSFSIKQSLVPNPPKVARRLSFVGTVTQN
jgi:hypothetical protein